jgi:hypothetical protein
VGQDVAAGHGRRAVGGESCEVCLRGVTEPGGLDRKDATRDLQDRPRGLLLVILPTLLHLGPQVDFELGNHLIAGGTSNGENCEGFGVGESSSDLVVVVNSGGHGRSIGPSARPVPTFQSCEAPAASRPPIGTWTPDSRHRTLVSGLDGVTVRRSAARQVAC